MGTLSAANIRVQESSIVTFKTDMRMEMVDSSIAMPMEMAKAMAMVDCNESTVYDDVLRGIRMCIEHDDIVLQLNEFVSVDENENSFHDALQ